MKEEISLEIHPPQKKKKEIHPMVIERITKEDYEQLYANTFDNLDEFD